EPGDNRLVLPQRVETPGFLQVRAELKVNDQTSTLSAVTVAKPAGHVLVLEDQAGQADGLVAVLQREGLQINRNSANTLPPSAAALSDFDAIVLVNTPATSLTLD